MNNKLRITKKKTKKKHRTFKHKIKTKLGLLFCLFVCVRVGGDVHT